MKCQHHARQGCAFHRESGETPFLLGSTRRLLSIAPRDQPTMWTEQQLGAAHLHALHHHQLFHQGLCLACQVHGALEQDHRMDCGVARLVQLLRVYSQHRGDAEGNR